MLFISSKKALFVLLFGILRRKKCMTLKLCLSIDRVLNIRNICVGKSCRKCAPEAIPDPFLTLVNHPKKPLHARNSFKNKIF